MATLQKLSIPCDRSERLHYIRRLFPLAKGTGLSDHFHGGRLNALKHLNQVDAVAYDRNRNFINGAVTRLSPYLRHGCITLKETFEHVHQRFGAQAEKLVFELAWRDYWRQVWYAQGHHILSDLEAPKVPLGNKPLPDTVKNAQTGLPCMNAFIHDLVDEGYVHNHGRMWFAAYVVHWLKVDWREAADWFENYLLDGDKASNHLSWQWIASVNSSKPYYFNKENLARYTGEKYCANCKINCPFDASYESINEKLFAGSVAGAAKTYRVNMPAKDALSTHQAVAICVHDEMLSGAHPLLRRPMAKVFVFDDFLHGKWPLKRLQFMADCLNELQDVEIWAGDTREILKARGVGQIITQDTPNKQLKALLEPFNPVYQPEVKFADSEVSEKRLRRFSRYWEKVGAELFGEDLMVKDKKGAPS